MADFELMLEAIKALQNDTDNKIVEARWKSVSNDPKSAEAAKNEFDSKYRGVDAKEKIGSSSVFVKIPLHKNSATRNVTIKTLNSKALPPFNNSLFHYTKSPSSFLNILNLGSIYTDNPQNITQKDPNIKDDLATYRYACFTSHPSKVAFEYDRPFGFEFSREGLQNLIDKMSPKGQMIDYHQLKMKASSKITRRNDGTFKLSTIHSSNSGFNDTYIAGVGAYKDGDKFIVLQGWNPRIISDDLYKDIVSWIIKNNKYKKSSGITGELLYFNTNYKHKLKFPNNASTHIIDYLDKHSTYRQYLTDIPGLNFENFRDIEITEGRQAKPEFSFKLNHDFVALDAEVAKGNFLSEIDELYAFTGIKGMLGGTGKLHNSQAPRIHDIVEVNDEISDIDQSELLSPEVISKLYSTFDEYETRVYVDADSINFKNKNILRAIWLPDIYYDSEVSKSVPIFLRQMLLRIYYLVVKKNLPEDEAAKQTCSELSFKDKNYENTILLPLFRIFRNSARTQVIFYAYEDGQKFINSSISNDFKDKDISIDTNTIVSNKDFQRYIIKDQKSNNTNTKITIENLTDITSGCVYKQKIVVGKSSEDDMLKMLNDPNCNMFILKDATGLESLIAKNFKAGSNRHSTSHARIGVQGIILRYTGSSDYEKATYYKKKLLASNSIYDIENWKDHIELLLYRKSNTFLELPGGGFKEKPSTEDSAKDFAINKLNEETGIFINDLIDLDESLYTYEGNAMRYEYKNVPALVQYNMSYYQLYGSILYQPKRRLADPNISANTIWIKLSSLLTNNDFMKRYANIMPLIEKFMENYGLIMLKKKLRLGDVNKSNNSKTNSNGPVFTNTSRIIRIINKGGDSLNDFINTDLGLEAVQILVDDLIMLHTNNSGNISQAVIVRLDALDQLTSHFNAEFRNKVADIYLQANSVIIKNNPSLKIVKNREQIAPENRKRKLRKNIVVKFDERIKELKKSA